MFIDNWKTRTSTARDYTVQHSQAITYASDGGPLGSQLIWSACLACDFNNDGERDLPPILADVAAALPTATDWPLY